MFRSRRRIAPPWLIVAVGCLISLVGMVWLGWTVKFVWYAERTVGMVTEMTKHAGTTTTYNRVRRHETTAIYYRPIVTFYDKSGNLRQVMESVGSSRPGWQVNQAVKILYAPDNPSNACIDSFMTVWMFPLVAVGMGVLFIVIGKVSKGAELVREGGTEI